MEFLTSGFQQVVESEVIEEVDKHQWWMRIVLRVRVSDVDSL